MKNVFTILLTLCVFALWGQGALTPLELVRAEQAAGEPFPQHTVLQASNERVDLKDEAPRTYELLELAPEAYSQLLAQQPDRMTLNVPSETYPGLQLELVRVDIFAEGFQVVESQTQQPAGVSYGLHYRGIVRGDESSIAALSFFENGDIMGIVSAEATGNLVLGQLQERSHQGLFILYRDQDVLQQMAYDCATPDEGPGYTPEQLKPTLETRALSDCVQMYFEVDYDIYQDKGGTQGATNYVTGLFNEMATLYANESINTSISEIFVWSSTSPYSSTSSSGMLSDFQNYRNGFNGDLAQLLSYQASGGIAAGFSGLCNSNPDNSMSFSSIGSTYAIVPTYSFTIMVVTHEFGHLFGSRHTHACVWNGNNTAIDGCAGQTEGSCSLPGYPSNGGTIMSYCHIQSVGINFNLGFGTQPGNVVRNNVSNASCLQPCDGGGGGPACSDNEINLSITLDNYPGETTWEVVNSSGATVASGGPYSGAGSSVNEDLCLPDGCYDFTIFDSYGDGICCGYGNGSYTLSDGSTVLASGGSFGSSETTSFCLGGGSNPPPSNYCASQGNNSSYEWIQRFQFGGIDNTSGNDGGYGDYTNISTSLTPGGSASVTLVPGFSGSSYSEYWRIWIDYNRDGDFNDSGELVGSGNGTGTLSGTLGISSSASAGATRLRVAMKYNSYSTPCESFTYGEVEDYIVNIGTSLPGAGGLPTAAVSGLVLKESTPGAGFSVFPNPAQDRVFLDFRSAEVSKVQLELMDLMGRTLQLRTNFADLGENRFEMSTTDLPEGTYIVRLRQNEQQFVKRVVISRR